MNEAFTATPQVEQGDGSFAEAFGETVPDAGTESQPADARTADYTGPMVWNGPVPTVPKFALVIGLGTNEGVAFQTAESSVETAIISVEPGAVETDVAPLALQPTLESDPSPGSQQPGGSKVDATGIAGFETPTVGTAAVLPPLSKLPDLPNAGPATASNTDLIKSGPLTTPTKTGTIAPSILATETANQGATDLSPEVSRSRKAAPPAIRFVPAADTRNDQIDPGNTSTLKAPDTGLVSIKVNQEAVVGQIRQDGDLAGPQAAEHGKSDTDNHANAALRPSQALAASLETVSEPVLPEQAPSVPAGQSLGPQLPAAPVDLAATTHSDVVPTAEHAAPPVLATSFWERFFSGSTASTRLASGTAVAEAPQETTTSSKSAKASDDHDSPDYPVLAASDVEKDPVGTPAMTDASERTPHPGAAPSSTPSPEIRTDAFSGSVSGLALSGWDGNQGMPGRWLHAFDPLAATSQMPAVPLSGTSGIQSLPVPQVAAQLAAVLVRNASSVTELALAPEELGRVKLRMEQDTANPDRMVIMISVDRPETLDLFRRHSSELADAIRNAGYSGADIGFDQSGGEGASGQRREPSSPAPAASFDDLDQPQATPMRTVGASLDLRL